MSKTKFCQGISDISDSYNAFILDQWGVLHNGEKPYEGVIDCLKEMKARNKYVIILSNSGKRAEENAETLKNLGIGPSLYDEIVTSGELTWQGLHDQNEGVFKGIGTKCFLLSRGGDRSIIDGLEHIELVKDIEDADFLLISGSDAPDKNLVDYYEPILKTAIRKRLKAICANPDNRMVIGNSYAIGPGMIARRYEDFGGVVSYIGKPHKPIFQHCIKLLQAKNIYPGDTVMIGDTMAHDILGASAVEIDTCLVKCGIHWGAFKEARSLAEVDKILNVLITQYHNIRPTYLVNMLNWGRALPDRKHKKRKTA
ncbi:MAG: TIGR01459 family HAD-type hydrolase [Micavibrio sp.]